MIGVSTDHVACVVDLAWPLVSAWVGGVHTHALVNVVSTALKRVDTLRDGGHELTICAPRSLAMFHRGSCRRRGWVDSKPVRLLWRRFLVGPTPPACVFEAHPRARGRFLFCLLTHSLAFERHRVWMWVEQQGTTQNIVPVCVTNAVQRASCRCLSPQLFNVHVHRTPCELLNITVGCRLALLPPSLPPTPPTPSTLPALDLPKKKVTLFVTDRCFVVVDAVSLVLAQRMSGHA
jgi:hypothetical protein